MHRLYPLLTFACIVVLMSIVAVSQTPQQREVKIGFSIENTKGERWQTDLEQFQQRAQELGAAVVIRSADGDDELQFKQVKEMLDSGIDALVFLPHDTGKAGRFIDASHAKHVPVISYDRLVTNAPVDLYVGFDLFSVGVLQAQSVVDRAPKGTYLLLGGSPLDANSRVVRAGQMKVLRPLIERGDIKVMADIWVPEWSATQAYMLVAEALRRHTGPFTAIVASNDAIAGGAIQALEDNKLSGKVLVTGQDADLAAVERLFEGTQLMTVYKPVGNEARTAAEAAVRLARQQDPQSRTAVVNGSQTTKAILLTPISVNEQNVKDTVLKDGFQKVETLKRGLPKEKWAELEQ